MTPSRPLSRTLPIMITIIMVGFFLRIFHLTTVPLRGDEAFSVQYWAGQPLSESLAKTATIEPHPVMTYATFRAWGLVAGTSELAMRLLPALLGLLGIPAIYAVGKRLGGTQTGLLAAAIFAVHPFEIWHAQDARNYAIWAGISLIALWLGLRAVEKNRRFDWVLYTLAASLAANIFYTEMLTMSAFGIYVLITYWDKWKRVASWIFAAAIAGGLSIASFVIFQLPLFARGGYTGSIGGTLDISQLWTHFLPVLFFGEITLPSATLSSLWWIVAIIGAIGLYLLWRTQRRLALLLTTLAIVPPLMLTILSLRLNIFTPRYVLAIVPALVLILATLIIYLFRRRTWSKALAVFIVGGWLVVGSISLRNYYFDPDYAKAPNWPTLTRYLQQYSHPEDVIIQSAVDSAFGYYYHQGQSTEAPDIALPETPAQPAATIRAKLDDLSQQYASIWQVGQEFPDWPNAGVVKSWLDEHMQVVLEGKPGGLNMLQYKPWDVPASEIAPRNLATFGDVTQLVGYNIILPSDKTGNMTIWLYWQPLKTTDTPLKVFVHLLGAINPATGSPLWTQDDRFPQNGRIATQTWQPNHLYRDVYTLPLSNVSDGKYTLEVGFYDPSTNARLTVGTADSYVLQSIDLK